MADENELIALTLDDARDRMRKAAEALRHDLQTIRTGRAHPSLVEHLRVDYQGTPLALNQLATITAPEPRLIVIQPWDRNGIPIITRAIQQSDLGINPQSDGVVIRLALPELTEQRRRDLVKQVGARQEGARVAVRNIRRDAQEELRRMEKARDISQDEERRAHDALEKITQDSIQQIDRVGSEKERELLEV